MIQYIKSGSSSQKIIFLHGNSVSANYWDTVLQAPEFSAYQCFALHLPGHGTNNPILENASEAYSFKGMSKAIIDFIENEIKDNYILVGHSLGTNIIGECTPYLQGCKGIFLTASNVIGKKLQPQNILKPNPALGAFFSEYPEDGAIQEMIANLSVQMSEQQKQFLFDAFKASDPQVRTGIATAVMNSDYIDEIEAIFNLQVPVGVLFGAEDKACYIDYLDTLNLNLWNSKTILIPNAGHYIQLDQPKLSNEWLLKFVQSCF